MPLAFAETGVGHHFEVATLPVGTRESTPPFVLLRGLKSIYRVAPGGELRSQEIGALSLYGLDMTESQQPLRLRL